VKRLSQRGQSIIELAVIFPLILFVFLGAWTGAALIANNDSAAQATGYGARIAAEIGNTCPEVDGSADCTAVTGCQQNANDPCQVDDEVLSAMLPALNQLSNSTATEIQIYEPKSCAGPSLPTTCSPSLGYGPPTSTDLTDNFEYCTGTKTWDLINGTGGSGIAPCITHRVGPYLLNLRNQTVDSEQAIGVSVSFKFTSPGLTFFTQTDSAYTDITFPPEGS
jgi:hypothetical protein